MISFFELLLKSPLLVRVFTSSSLVTLEVILIVVVRVGEGVGVGFLVAEGFGEGAFVGVTTGFRSTQKLAVPLASKYLSLAAARTVT